MLVPQPKAVYLPFAFPMQRRIDTQVGEKQQVVSDMFERVLILVRELDEHLGLS